MRDLLRATAVFTEAEVAVALELFDEGTGDGGPGTREVPREGAAGGPASRVPGPDYLHLAAFAPDDTLVGWACYGPTPGTDRAWDLYWIAVDPAAQGAGAGTRLLGEVERRLAERSARLLVVETSSRPAYDATRAFYARRGYTEAARVPGYYAPGDDRVILVKRLPHTRFPDRGSTRSHSPHSGQPHDGRGAAA